MANILFTTELARLLEGTGVAANCYDPGLVVTNFNQDNGTLARMTMAVMKRFLRLLPAARSLHESYGKSARVKFEIRKYHGGE